MKRSSLHQPIFVSMSNQDHRNIVADEIKSNMIPAESGRSSDLKEVMEFYDNGTWKVPLKNVIDWRYGESVHSLAHGKDVGMLNSQLLLIAYNQFSNIPFVFNYYSYLLIYSFHPFMFFRNKIK